MASARDSNEPPSIAFTDAAIDDLRRIGPDGAAQAVKKLGLLLDSPLAGYPLTGDLAGFRKLVVGDNTWRIVYRIDDAKTITVCEIWAIGPRANDEVYREATVRVARAAHTNPDLVPLADVVERLGRHAGRLTTLLESLRHRTHGTAPTETEPSEVVPAWLAGRLVDQVGLPPEKVAALALKEAIALWEDFMRRPR